MGGREGGGGGGGLLGFDGECGDADRGLQLWGTEVQERMGDVGMWTGECG